jgi:3-oxoadipate enol-lactonase
MTKLFHVESGQGDPVVLVHAIGCDHHMWDSLAPALALHYRVVRVDVRGHGRSPVPDGDYSLEALADDVLAALDDLEIDKAHWVGLSMGGMIGQAFAINHPDRLGRLVLANTTSSYGDDGPKTWEARMKAVREGGMAAIADLVMQRYFSDDFRASHPGVVSKVKERVLATPAKGYLSCCAAIRDLDFTRDLSSIHARTFVIAGGHDAGTPVAMSQAIVDRIAGAQLAVMADAAHLSAVEKPEAFNALVQDFLAAP